jgi:hypothetical protein
MHRFCFADQRKIRRNRCNYCVSSDVCTPFSKRRLCLSLGFHVLFRIWPQKINYPGCRLADGDVEIWTVPLPNRPGILLTPIFQVASDKELHLALQRPGLKGVRPLQLLANLSRIEVYCAIIFLIAERCV